MSDPPSFESIVDRFEEMHAQPTNEGVALSPQPHTQHQPPPPKMQSIEDWERDQEAIEAQFAAESKKKRPLIEPMKKKPRKVTDADELRAEEAAVQEMGNGNWVGKLQMYRDTRPVPNGNGMEWTEGNEVNPLPRFTCTLIISETTTSFGYAMIGTTGKLVSFGNKKSAKQWAAKKAIDWLIANEYLPEDGSIPHKAVPAPQPKKAKIPPPQPSSSSSTTSTSSPSPLPQAQAPSSYAQRIPDLCRALSISIPTYRLSQEAPGSPLYDAYADFGGDTAIDGKVGEVYNVFGKKNAKEQVAKIVYSFLKDIERQRMEQFEKLNMSEDDESDEDRKRKRGANVDIESPELRNKSVKGSP